VGDSLSAANRGARLGAIANKDLDQQWIRSNTYLWKWGPCRATAVLPWAAVCAAGQNPGLHREMGLRTIHPLNPRQSRAILDLREDIGQLAKPVCDGAPEQRDCLLPSPPAARKSVRLGRHRLTPVTPRKLGGDIGTTTVFSPW